MPSCNITYPQNAFGVEDLSKADLQKGAKDYMKAIGLTDAEITRSDGELWATWPPWSL